MLSIDGANGLQGMMETTKQREMDGMNGMHGVQGLGGVGHQAMPPSQCIMNQIQMQWGNACDGMQGNANVAADFEYCVFLFFE